MRSRLLLLVAIPTMTALILGGFRIVSSVQSALTYQRVRQLATMGKDVTVLAQSLENERDQTVLYIALDTNGGRANGLSGQPSARADAKPQLATLSSDQRATNAASRTVTGMAAGIGPSYPAQTRQAAAAMVNALDTLPSLRKAATGSHLPLLVVAQKYGATINALISFNDDIAQGAGDARLDQTVDVLGLVSVMKEDASQQRAILAAALTQGSFAPGELSALEQSVAAQQTTLQAFYAAATPSQLQLWNRSVSRSDSGLASSEEQQALALASGPGTSGSLAADPTTANDWYTTMSNTISSQMGSVESRLVSSVMSRAESLRTSAIISAAVVAAAVLLVLVLAMLFTTIVGRSMVRPLRRLRGDALRIAEVRLPEMVKRLSESEGTAGDLEVRPIDVDSADEIGEVARAFDQVHAEAIRLASNEARLRGNVNAMFVNLSRRTQSLVERQIHLIDELEQGEQDPERLSNLFRLDHLATRMRRNSENLLVLAGHGTARRWKQPVPLVDVLRAGVSEIEHYERVVFNVQPGIAVKGQVVNDVVHLLAELLENATVFSPAQSRVSVSGHLLNSGGVLLDITDQGVGMDAEEMAQANWRLDNPPVVDVAVARRMGLFVVGRLASRHGIRIRLRPAPNGGLTALIWLPDETITYDAAGVTPGLPRVELDAATWPTGAGGLQPFGPDARASAHAAVTAARAPRFMAIGPGVEEDQPRGPAAARQQAAMPDGEPAPAGASGPAGAAGPPRGAEVSSLSAGSQAPLPRRVAELPPADSGERLAEERDTQPEHVFAAPISDQPNGQGGAAAALDSRPGPADQPDLNGSAGAGDARADAASLEPAQPGDISRPDLLGGVLAPTGSELIMKGTVAPGEAGRLPIFESVESDWFRRGRHQVAAAGPAGQDPGQPAGDWTSAADEGWRAAEAAGSPSSGGLTPAGLPRRIPQANLVPGGVAEPEREAQPGLVRSAAATRERLASFQRGSQEGRAALRGEDSGGEDEDAP